METNGGFGKYASAELRCLLHRIADKWTVLVFCLLEKGPKRFTELQRELGGVSQKVLTQSLRGLERDGLISRTVYAQVPPRVEYELTPLGRTLSTPLASLLDWALAHSEDIAEARSSYDTRISRAPKGAEPDKLQQH